VKIQFAPYFLEFRYPFVLSHGTRTHTPVVFVKIEHASFTAFGEATLPPYLPDTQESVIKFIKSIDLTQFDFPYDIEVIHKYLDTFPGSYPAKAALDIALHDLIGKYKEVSVSELLNLQANDYPFCTYTLGMGDKTSIENKIRDSSDFNYFKLKLGCENDREIIETFKHLCDKPFCVDANQGWGNKEHALDMIYWLLEMGCTLIEQPLSKFNYEDLKWLTSHSPIPVIADESIQTLEDFNSYQKSFDGINVKLMKCGGLFKAKKLITEAKDMNMKILVGCMSESSCGVTAAAHLTPLADLADLDGPYLIKNDPFDGMKIKNGKIFIDKRSPGLGITLKEESSLNFID
jgi:L-Ala-D/L-Glu epimerase